jgi:hypothetical protein
MSTESISNLEISYNEHDEVIVTISGTPEKQLLETRRLVLTPSKATLLAELLIKAASGAIDSIRKKAEEARIAALPPDDRSARVLTNGSPVTGS